MAEFQSEEKGPVVQTWSFTSNLVLLNLWDLQGISYLDTWWYLLLVIVTTLLMMCCLQILVQKGWLAKNMWYQNATLLGIFNISPTPRQFWVDGIPSLPSMGYSEQLLRPRRFVPIEVSSQEKHVSKNSKDSLPTPIRIHGNGKFTYMEWLLFMVNVGKYSIHGSYGNEPTPYDIYISDFFTRDLL